MAVLVEIDGQSGFCFGVEKAISTAKGHLEKSPSLFTLGEIVHNAQEVARLEQLGLVTISPEKFASLQGSSVLFRAHGEPPASYQLAAQNNITVIDATCPVVLKLQQRISKAWKSMKELNGQVVIYGQKNHAEVIGLAGQTNNEAIIIEDILELSKIDFSRPIELFCQTTKSIEGYRHIVAEIEKRLPEHSTFLPHDTICRQVSNRVPNIKQFAARHSHIIFVGGANSSNAKVLYSNCKQVNSQSYFISSYDQIMATWFNNHPTSVGVCGATSTPRWQLEQVASSIINLLKNL